MNVEQLALLAGILFILIAVVGGGFTVKEVSIPKVPGWARVVALVVGLAFAGPYVVSRFVTVTPDTTDTATGQSRIVYADTQPDRSAHGIELDRFEVRAPHDPPRLDDRVQVSFTLKNVGAAPLTFQETFVAARSPGEQNRDFGHGHERLTLAPNETVSVKANIIVDSPGVWRFWPCYTLNAGREEDFCPTRWRSVPLSVGE